MAEKEKGARNIVRRLDFGVVRSKVTPAKRPVPTPAKKPLSSTDDDSISAFSDEPVRVAVKSSRPAMRPARPAMRPAASSVSRPTPNLASKPSPKPVVSRGFRMDFAPVHSKMPMMGTSKKPQISISTPKVTTSEATAIFAPKPATSIKATVSHTTIEAPRSSAPRPVRSRGSMMDFVRRPASRSARHLSPDPIPAPEPIKPTAAVSPAKPAKPAKRPAFRPKFAPVKKPQPVEAEPMMDDADLMATLAGFASAKNEEVPRHPRVLKPAPKSSAKSPAAHPAVRPAAPARRAPVVLKPTPKSQDPFDDFSEDLFGGDGFGDDIDRIEAEIEAEANDFVKEPRPLFGDPLVQLSKAREEERKKLTPEEKANLKNESYARANRPAKRSPYATLYDTKSPFITSTASVDKRPLSASAPTGDGPALRSSNASGATKKDTKKSHIPELKKSHAPLKNTYRSRMKKQLADDAKEIHRQTMVMSTPEAKPHNTALIVGIALTILLGAGVGALVYLVFFQ